MPGKGNVVLTGNMRNVMQESASTAVSFVRSKADRLHLDPEWLKEIDLHVHIPQHGTPKDGPSAGVTMFAAVASLLLGAPVRSDVAMTGEISLRGRVLPVGGVKEKLLAAHRAGIKHVLIPAKNRRDLEDVPQDVKNEIKITLVSSMERSCRRAGAAAALSGAERVAGGDRGAGGGAVGRGRRGGLTVFARWVSAAAETLAVARRARSRSAASGTPRPGRRRSDPRPSPRRSARRAGRARARTARARRR